ncbi:tetratricopeptide repeat protein [Planctomicrobium piriforme]|nr:tetratricopeptide repeat protein [Planctomicrobium piriforme]
MRDGLVVCGLIVLTLLAYAGTFRNGFVDYDDPDYVYSNPIVAQGLTLEGLRYAWTTFDVGNWIPLTWLSYELDVQMFGPRPAGFHATSILLHTLNAVLFYFWLRLATGALGRSAIAAALFAVHPLHVESVAWIAERKDVLSTFWLLAALLLFRWYTVSPRLGRYLAFLLAYACGLLSKSMLVTLPVLLLLANYWPLLRTRWNCGGDGDARVRSVKTLLLEQAAPLALAVLCSLITIWAQSSVGAMIDLEEHSFPQRLAHAAQACGWYLQKTFVPTELGVCYLYANNVQSLAIQALNLAVLAAIAAWVVFNARRRPWLLFGFGWFFISLLPVIGLIQVGAQAYADRYSYVPHLGLLVAIVWQLHDWLCRVRYGKVIGVVTTVAALGMLTGLTVRQVTVWRNTTTLFEHLLELDPRNWLAHSKLSAESYRAGHKDDAERHASKALELNPQFSPALNDLGLLRIEQGKLDEAAKLFEAALLLNPSDRRAVFNRARVARLQGDFPVAERLYSQMKQLKPESLATRVELAQVYIAQNRYREALPELMAAIELSPRDPELRSHAAMVLAELGLGRTAIDQLKVAIQLAPGEPGLHDNLGLLLQAQGNPQAALESFQRARQLNPDDPLARERIPALRSQLGLPEE